MVGRPREFDTDQVLEAAMRAFWAKGYEATSLADLMSATGLHKGSLYQAFGDKHSLFLRSLERYLEDMRRIKNKLLKEAPTPLDGLRAVAHGMIDIVDTEAECPMGCMAINTLIELAPHDPEVQKVLDAHIRSMRQSVSRAVTDAQQAGQIGHSRTPEVITLMLMTFVAGLGTNLKGPITKAQAHELLDAQFEAML